MSKLLIGKSVDNLRYGSKIEWPIEAVTETFGIFGVRGSGKSTTAKVLVEELTKAGQQCVIIDPLGVWWGLKSSADGKQEGLPFTVIGGNHSDVPINDRAGALVADLVIETTNPLIIDLSQLRKAPGRSFMAAFVDQLWHRASGKPVHIVVDECDLFAPMRPVKGAEALLGGMEDLVRRGRNKGIGSTMISQRPASVHTDIRSQVSVLIAHRLTGTHDRAALDAWVEAHGDRDQRAVMMGKLASLGTGVAWMWSPQFLELFGEVLVRQPTTFDSMATPKPGQRQIVPRKLAKADLSVLKDKMASIVIEAEQNDPRALKARILTLQKALDNALKATGQVTEVEKIVERVIEPDLTEPLSHLSNVLSSALSIFEKQVQTAVMVAKRSPQAVDKVVEDRPLSPKDYIGVPDDPPQRRALSQMTPTMAAAKRHQRDGTTPPSSGSGDLNGPMRKLLIVLATYGPRTKQQLALQAGYAANGGAFGNPLGKLRSMGYVTKGSPIEITGVGQFALGDFDPLPTGQALIDHWMAAVSGPMAKILGALIEQWPKSYQRDELAEVCGYAPGGGAFGNPLGKLRTLGLVNKGPDIALTDEFAEAIQ